jgi:hypothetical protein
VSKSERRRLGRARGRESHRPGGHRTRRASGAIDLGDLRLIDAHVAELLEAHVSALVRIARTEIEVHLGERERMLSIPRLIGRER